MVGKKLVGRLRQFITDTLSAGEPVREVGGNRLRMCANTASRHRSQQIMG